MFVANQVRTALSGLAAAVGAASLVACGLGSDASSGNGSGGPSGPAVQPTGPGSGPVDPGQTPAPAPSPTKPDGPTCTRAAQAKTAPIALWDAFMKDIPGLTGAARAQRVDKLMADVAAAGGTPLEDPAGDRVVFLARGASPTGSWSVAGSFEGWQTAKALAMTAVPDTDLFTVETKIPRGASYEYKLLVSANDGGFVEDPLAKNVVWDGIDRGLNVKGEFNAVGHPQDQARESGRLVALGSVHATTLGDDRDVWLYYPARYDDGKCDALPSIVFHDGLESLTRGGFAKVADGLYAQHPELSAVLAFVGLPSQDVRTDQYTFGTATARGPAYVSFLTDELWPELAKSERLCSKPAARGMAGASLGGLISTYAAFEKPAAWGWVGAQSASYFWNDNAMITRVQSDPKIPARFYLDSGCPDDNCDVVDQMDTVMTQKAYDHVRIKQANAQHDWSFWRDRLAGLLTHFRDKQTDCN